MTRTRSWLLLLAAFALAVSPAIAQDATPTPTPAETPEDPASEMGEVIVVTASRTEQQLADAPAAITVLTAQDIEMIPADDYGDLMRQVPGVNVAQTSARDINMTTRGSTNTLATSTLVLVDGRSLYLDFFGFVMYDLLPVNTAEIKQIEAVRGPGSAVWGANAMSGVVNLITKRPGEMAGTHLIAGGGELGSAYGSVTHAGQMEDFGYKVSGGYLEQDAYDRPTGVIPGSNPPVTYPDFPNSGTEQLKGDVRLEWDLDDSSTFGVGGGYASTDGIVHTGIGPFDVDDSTEMSNFKADYNRMALHVGFYANLLDADSVNLLTRGADGQPLGFAFNTDTYHFDISNTTVLAMSHIFTYGGNYRTSDFELEIAPEGTEKDEWGFFLQDEILIGDKLRWVIGGRYDEIDPLEDGVFTPRTSLLFAPTSNHTFRVSYNEAFRTPSAINSYLDVTILQPLFGPFAVPADANGDAALVEEHLTAYEVGYVGTYDSGVILTLAAYRNETENSIDFFTQQVYGPGNLPSPSPVLPPFLIPCFNVPGNQVCAVIPGVGTIPGLGGFIPSDYSYRNIGETIDTGVEFSVQQRRGSWNWFFNTSWQDEPEFEGLDSTSDQNLPPEWRANLGLGYDPGFWFANVNVNYQDEAYWGDVLFARGYTDSFTMLNTAIGVRLFDERMTLQLIGANVTDEEVQQHIFGDIISRKITGQVGFSF
jgi:outer membrane receptor protein involved in Fe transport